jgi:hypothetical protein
MSSPIAAVREISRVKVARLPHGSNLTVTIWTGVHDCALLFDEQLTHFPWNRLTGPGACTDRVVGTLLEIGTYSLPGTDVCWLDRSVHTPLFFLYTPVDFTLTRCRSVHGRIAGVAGAALLLPSGHEAVTRTGDEIAECLDARLARALS